MIICRSSFQMSFTLSMSGIIDSRAASDVTNVAMKRIHRTGLGRWLRRWLGRWLGRRVLKWLRMLRQQYLQLFDTPERVLYDGPEVHQLCTDDVRGRGLLGDTGVGGRSWGGGRKGRRNREGGPGRGVLGGYWQWRIRLLLRAAGAHGRTAAKDDPKGNSNLKR